MRGLRASEWFGPCTLALITWLLWGLVWPLGLGLWLTYMVGLVLARRLITMAYLRRSQNLSALQRQLWAERIQWFVLLTPAGWGVLTFLYYKQVPPEVQFLCMTVFLGIGTVGANVLGPNWEKHGRYLVAMVVPGTAGLVWQTAQMYQRTGHWRVTDTAIICFAVFFWVVLRRAGQTSYVSAVRSLDLQFEREQLVRQLEERSEALTKASQSRSRLLAGAAHDLRQPVHALNLYADWLRTEPELAPELSVKIIAATQGVNRLFNSLFEFARVDHGPTELSLHPVDVTELLADMRGQYMPMAHAKGLSLRTRCTLFCTNSDALALRRLLGNLIDNAIKYTATGGVLVSARMRAGHSVIEVWDTGIGIDSEHQSRVFEEFFRVQDSGGTRDSFGLGLAIVSRLAERLQITVGLTSVPGQGSRFTLRMPR